MRKLSMSLKSKGHDNQGYGHKQTKEYYFSSDTHLLLVILQNKSSMYILTSINTYYTLALNK